MWTVTSRSIIVIFGWLILPCAWGYIPRAHFIFEKAAEQHGRGAYQVVQEVQIPIGQDTFAAREYWTIVNGESLYVFIEGLKSWQDRIKMAVVFTKDKRYSVNENGQVQTDFVSRDFIEPYFHFRSAKGIAGFLVNAQIAPQNALAELPAPANLTLKPKIEPQKFVRLARLDSAITYAIGKATPDAAKVGFPGLWIEQDTFNVLKLRLPSLSEVRAEDYAIYPQNLQLPKKRTVRWGQNSATIFTVKVAHLGSAGEAQNKVQPGYLSDLVDRQKMRALLPADPVVKEFYTRFR